MGAEHDHGAGGHAHNHAAGANTKMLGWALALTSTYLVAEVIGAFVFNSLALLSDAAHMLTDVAALVIALVAIRIGQRPADDKRTFGYKRFEILAAAFNAMLLFAVAIYVVVEAAQRFREPEAVQSTGMLIVAAIGLAANLIAAVILASGDKDNMNLRAALLHVVVDALGSVGVLVSAMIVRWTGFARADIIAAVLIAVLVIPQAIALIRNAGAVLLELAPSSLDARVVEEWMTGRPGVHDVHDLHIWSIHGTDAVLTAHVTVDEGLGFDDACSILCDMETGLADEFGVGHATLQLETPAHHAHERPRQI